jgi:hypothetical protein
MFISIYKPLLRQLVRTNSSYELHITYTTL